MNQLRTLLFIVLATAANLAASAPLRSFGADAPLVSPFGGASRESSVEQELRP
ncbi:hypothetical protein PHLGIDRAFT_130685, partial [Phlebiopsis gigantea 11061_1 CR5-6]